jgi:hypothetical protein
LFSQQKEEYQLTAAGGQKGGAKVALADKTSCF